MTKFYINNAPAPYVPTTIRGAWNAVPSSRIFMLGTEKYGDIITSIYEYDQSAVNPHSVLILRAVSSKLQAQTISGNVDVILGVQQSAVDANCYWHVHIYVTQGSTDVVRGTLLNNYVEDVTNEWVGKTARTLQFPATLSSVAVTAGDRIVVELGYVSRNVGTGWYAYLWYGTQNEFQNIDGVDLAPADTLLDDKVGTVNFSQTILFEVVPAQISHVQTQIVEFVSLSGSQISQLVTQVAEDAPALVSRITHLVVQVAEGKAGPLPSISGIYFMNAGKLTGHDSYYGNIELKIPDPTIRLAYFGE